MARAPLPRWIVDNRTSVAREAAPYRGLTPAQRSQAAARAAAEREGLMVFRLGPLRIDVFTPSIDFSWEAGRTRVQHEIEGHGYELFATLHDYPQGHKRFFLRKTL